MQFKEITDKNQWNDFIMSNLNTDILQSWEWGEIKKIEGWEPFRFGLIQDDGAIALASMLLMKRASFLGNLGYIPHGPVYLEIGILKKYWDEFQEELSTWAQKKKIFSIEIEPKIPVGTIHELSHGIWKITGRNRQPKYKLLIDLTKAEEEILAGMQKNTRYNIGYAERKGVEIKQYMLSDVDIDKVVDKFYNLLLDMQKRADGYPIRSKEYFKRLVEEFKNGDRVRIFEASLYGEVIVMNFTFFTNVWASSFYAGSNRLHPKVKAPYLLRWRSIQEAKKRGCKIYDFWGIVPDSEQHKGYSDHKLSFGGERVDFVGIIEKKLNWRATLWPILLKLRELVISFKSGKNNGTNKD